MALQSLQPRRLPTRGEALNIPEAIQKMNCKIPIYLTSLKVQIWNIITKKPRQKATPAYIWERNPKKKIITMLMVF